MAAAMARAKSAAVGKPDSRTFAPLDPPTAAAEDSKHARRMIHLHPRPREFRNGAARAGTARPGPSSPAAPGRRNAVSDHVYKHIELTGSSANGIEDAIHNAIERAGRTVHNMRWFEVRNTRGHIEGGKVVHWQVTIEVGFTLDG